MVPSAAMLTIESAMGAAGTAPSAPGAEAASASESRRRCVARGRAPSCIITMVSVLSVVFSSAAMPESTESARVAPPGATTGDMYAVVRQNSSHQRRPSSESTSTIGASGNVPRKVSMLWQSTGLPSSMRNCFGSEPPKREPEPAATITVAISIDSISPRRIWGVRP